MHQRRQVINRFVEGVVRLSTLKTDVSEQPHVVETPHGFHPLRVYIRWSLEHEGRSSVEVENWMARNVATMSLNRIMTRLEEK
jgi:hypothetical protein